MKDQISRKHRLREMAWIQREIAEAVNNASALIPNYQTASWFQLEAAAKIGDQSATAEMTRRKELP